MEVEVEAVKCNTACRYETKGEAQRHKGTAERCLHRTTPHHPLSVMNADSEKQVWLWAAEMGADPTSEDQACKWPGRVSKTLRQLLEDRWPVELQ